MAGWVALEKMVMLVLLMLVGFAAAKAQWVDSAFSQKTSRLVANVFIVATILSSVVGVQPLLTGGEMAVVVAAVFVLFAIAGVLGWVCARLLPLSQGDRTAAWLSVFFMNNVFVGFPVVEALFGESAVFCASLTTLPFNLLLFSLGVSRLRAGQGQGRVTLREVFSPALVGTLAAMVIFLLHIPLPALVGDTIKTLSGATVPLSMIVIGISLSRVPMGQALRDGKAYVVSLAANAPLVIAEAKPFCTAGMNSLGILPPLTWSTNVRPIAPSSAGPISKMMSANLPRPPVCFLNTSRC